MTYDPIPQVIIHNKPIHWLVTIALLTLNEWERSLQEGELATLDRSGFRERRQCRNLVPIFAEVSLGLRLSFATEASRGRLREDCSLNPAQFCPLPVLLQKNAVSNPQGFLFSTREQMKTTHHRSRTFPGDHGRALT